MPVEPPPGQITRIVTNRYGRAILTPAPALLVSALLTGWAKEGYQRLSLPVGAALGAMAVVRNDADEKAWIGSLGYGPEQSDWLKSGDTGLSSKTIYAVMTGRWHILPGGKSGYAIPNDADDFGRCHRLLERHPEFRPRLGEMADLSSSRWLGSRWAKLVEHWDELTALFTAGNTAQVTQRIQELIA